MNRRESIRNTSLAASVPRATRSDGKIDFLLSFADHLQPTPLYDYNQMAYRLDLDDARLRPAQLQ